MAFNDQEKQLILYGQQNGKTADEITTAIARLRSGVTPPTPTQPEQNSVPKDLAIGAAKGAGSSVKAIADTVTSAAPTMIAGPVLSAIPKVHEAIAGHLDDLKNKLFNAIGLTDDNLKADNTTQKVGKGIETAAELALPLAGPKIAKVATAGLDLSAQALKTGLKLTEGAADYAAGRLPKFLGIFTGESDDVIRAALRDPQAADTGIADGDAALREVVQQGASGSIKIRDAFTKAYRDAKAEVLGQYQKTLIPRNNVKGMFNSMLKDNGVEIGQDGTLDFTTSKIVANPGEVSKIQAAYQALKKWDTFNIDSLDEYKQLVGKLTRFADDAGTPSKSPFLGRLYNQLDTIAKQRLPKDVAAKYGELNKNFSNNIGLYDDVVDAFNSGDPFSKLANALGKNKDSLRQVLEFYAQQDGGKDVLPVVAGRELAMEKTAAFGFLNPRSWMDLLISPKTQAKITTRVGEALQQNLK